MVAVSSAAAAVVVDYEISFFLQMESKGEVIVFDCGCLYEFDNSWKRATAAFDMGGGCEHSVGMSGYINFRMNVGGEGVCG